MELSTTLSNMELPFNVSDLTGSGMALLGLVASFILLGLAFAFVPKLIKIIFDAFGYERGVKRDEYGNRVHFQSPEAKAYFENFKREKGWK